jgi:hypothetical protein
MIELKGIKLPELPLKKLIKVSDILYFDGPLLSHFQTTENDHYLFYWVDVDDFFNRWLIFRVNIEKLKRYVNGKTSLFEILTNSEDNYIFKVDIDEGLDYKNVELVFVGNLPDNYIPERESFYKYQPLGDEFDLSLYSIKFNTGILQAYFKDSTKVPYNEINLHLFGPAMFGLHEITEGLSKSYIARRVKAMPKDQRDFIKHDKAFLKKSTELNYFANVGGSFSALFKSASSSIPMAGMQSEEDSFMAYLMEFITVSENFEELSEYVKNIDKKIISSYKFLLQTIIGNKLEFYLRWENSVTNVSQKRDLGFTKAIKIMEVLERLEYDEKQELKLTGRFVAAHTKNGYYEFEEIGGDNYSKGKMDKDRQQMSSLIKFSSIYDVIIERRESKQAGNKAPKIQDILISFVEADSNYT